MSTHPYIPLYVDDYDAHTSHLTPAEDGVYGRLLRLCWRTPGCSLPLDMAWISRKIRLSDEEFDRVAKPVLDEFFTVVRGRLVQRRLKREYDTISRKKTARKLAGKKGGEAKAQKHQGKSSSNATILPADTRAFPEPEPEPEPDRLSVSKETGDGKPIAAPDPNKEGWDRAKSILESRGKLKPAAAGKFFGMLLSEFKLEARDLLPSVVRCESLGTEEPRAYLRKAAAAVAQRRGEVALSAEDRVAGWGPDTWDKAVEGYREGGRWSEAMGPAPDRPGCRAPKVILAKHGYDLSPDLPFEPQRPAA